MSVDWKKVEADFFTEVNKMRKDPAYLIPALENLSKDFKGDILYRPGEIPLQTVEGVAVIDELIEELKTQASLGDLERKEDLDSASRDHANDIGPKGLTSHDGSDGSNCSDRIERYCEWEGICAENLDFGSKTGLNCLLSLMVDDGVKSRGHRKNLLNPNAKFIGVAGANHKEYDACLVCVFTGGAREKGKPFFDRDSYKYEFPKDLSSKPDKRKIQNTYQIDDEDAPDNTVSVSTVKKTVRYGNKVHRITRKTYTLKDGSTTIVEVEDI
jgi:hypothetical protein